MFSFLSAREQRSVHPSMFGDVELIRTCDSSGEEVTLLQLGGSLQSATYHGDRWNWPPFAYIRAFDHMFESDTYRIDAGMDPISDVLMVGGGGFSYPKHVLTTRPRITIDVVEIDPSIVKLARRHMYLDRLERYLLLEGRLDHLEVFIEDGIDHLQKSDSLYDAIANDTFEGSCAVSSFLDETGIDLVKHHLNDGGLYLTNFVVDLTGSGPAKLNSFVDRLSQAFGSVHIIDACDDEFGGADNYIVIATDAEYEFTDSIPY